MDDTIPLKSYMDLDVWKRAVALATACYRVTRSFPDDERFGLTSQMRRSAISIASNIAEGYGRNQIGQFIQFLRIAQGSARELETQLVIAHEVGLLEAEVAAEPRAECDRVCRMLRALIRSLETKQRGP